MVLKYIVTFFEPKFKLFCDLFPARRAIHTIYIQHDKLHPSFHTTIGLVHKVQTYLFPILYMNLASFTRTFA